jgi:hypothetical protein
MKWMLRYNDWQNDPISQGNAGNGISSRFDLVDQTNITNPFLLPNAFGGIDSKVASAFDVLSTGKTYGISGPTYFEQPVFAWIPKWVNTSHVGQPNVFYFDWQEFSEH